MVLNHTLKFTTFGRFCLAEKYGVSLTNGMSCRFFFSEALRFVYECAFAHSFSPISGIPQI